MGTGLGETAEVGDLPSMCKVLGSIPSTMKRDDKGQKERRGEAGRRGEMGNGEGDGRGRGEEGRCQA